MTLAEEIAAKLRKAAGTTSTTTAETPRVETINTSSLQVKSGSGF